MPEISKEFLGRGWKFPVEVDKRTGRILMSEYDEDIKQAINIIVMTKKGERVFLPEFGCDIHRFVYDMSDYTTLKQMEMAVTEAINMWEDRIENLSVAADPAVGEEGKIHIEISYRVKGTASVYSIIYPYYFNEGM